MAATASKPRKTAEKPATFRLTMTIGEKSYAVRPMPVEPGGGIARLVRVRPSDSADPYHVHRDEDGA